MRSLPPPCAPLRRFFCAACCCCACCCCCCSSFLTTRLISDILTFIVSPPKLTLSPFFLRASTLRSSSPSRGTSTRSPTSAHWLQSSLHAMNSELPREQHNLCFLMDSCP